MYFHRTVQNRTALAMEPLRNLTCIIHRLSAQILTFPLTFAVKLC